MLHFKLSCQWIFPPSSSSETKTQETSSGIYAVFLKLLFSVLSCKCGIIAFAFQNRIVLNRIRSALFSILQIL